MLAFLSKLPWAMTILKWIRGNPIQALQLLGIVSLVAAALYFYFDYRDAKSDVRELRADLKAEEALSEALEGRLDEFELAQELQAQRLIDIEISQAETRRRISVLTDELSSLELERLLDENPDEAAAIINERFNALLGMFDDATAPAR